MSKFSKIATAFVLFCAALSIAMLVYDRRTWSEKEWVQAKDSSHVVMYFYLNGVRWEGRIKPLPEQHNVNGNIQWTAIAVSDEGDIVPRPGSDMFKGDRDSARKFIEELYAADDSDS